MAFTTWPRVLPPALENSFEVFDGPFRLFLDAARHNLASDGIERALTCREDKVSYAHALRIWAYGSGRAVGSNHRSRHGPILEPDHGIGTQTFRGSAAGNAEGQLQIEIAPLITLRTMNRDVGG